MATKTPSVFISLIAPVMTLRRRTPVTAGGKPVEPSTSSTTESQITVTFGLAKSRFCRIFSARSSPRRWTRVTLEAWLVR